MKVHKGYYKRVINKVMLDEIEDLDERAVYAREVAVEFFGGRKALSERLGHSESHLNKLRYQGLPLTELMAWRIDSWNEGMNINDLRPDLYPPNDEGVPERCWNCTWRTGLTSTPDVD